MVTYERLKTKENFKSLVLKVVLVAYERWSPTRAFRYRDIDLETFGNFGKLVAENRWSLTRGSPIIVDHLLSL